MKYITVFILSFLIFPILLSASGNYIIVTSATSKKQLRLIKSKLKSLGLNMTYKTTKTKYVVYSGPYKNEKNAFIAVKRAKKYFPNARALKKESKTEEQASVVKQKNSGGFHVGTALGFASAPSTHEGLVDITEPKNSGLTYSLEGGYTFKNGISLAGGYMRVDTSDLVFDNIYGVVNYRFDDFYNFVPYVGVLGGYSNLTWDTDPIENPSQESNNDSSSFIAGTQIGASYDGFEYISLYSTYQCLFMGHTTYLSDGTNDSKLQHKTIHSLQMGVQFNF